MYSIVILTLLSLFLWQGSFAFDTWIKYSIESPYLNDHVNVSDSENVQRSIPATYPVYSGTFTSVCVCRYLCIFLDAGMFDAYEVDCRVQGKTALGKTCFSGLKPESSKDWQSNPALCVLHHQWDLLWVQYEKMSKMFHTRAEKNSHSFPLFYHTSLFIQGNAATQTVQVAEFLTSLFLRVSGF